MRKKSLFAVVMILLAVNFTVFAQDEERDVIEINFYGGIGIPGSGLTDWQTGGEERAAKTGFDLGMDVGYFLNPKLIVGINFIYTQFTFDNTMEQSDHSHRLYNPNLYIKYSFEGESYWVPFVKAHVGLDNPKFSTFVTNEAANRFRELSYDPAFAVGFGLGLFYYTADYSGLYLEANYHHAFSKDVKATYLGNDYKFGEDLATFDIHAGIRVLFGTGG